MSDKQLFVTQITDVNDSTSAHTDSLGDIRWVGNNAYKYVKFNSATANVAATVGSLVVYHGANGVDDNEVAKDYTDGSLVAGVLVSVPGDGQYCWIQIKGPSTLTIAYTAVPVDGQPITKGNADGAATKANEVDTAGAYKQVIGHSIDVANKKIVLDCPF